MIVKTIIRLIADKEKILKVVTQVIKRDGVIAQFDNNRIYLAIQKAATTASQTIENIVTKRNLYTTRTPDCC